MNKQVKDAGLIIAILLVTVAAATAQIKNETLPTLRGDAAIEELKQKGEYDSLMAAARSAGIEKAETPEPGTDDAIGQSTKLIAPDGAAGDQYGHSVSISGNTAVIASFVDNIGANTDQGSVYVFVKSGTNWTFQQQLTASDGAAQDQFGSSVSIFGNTVIVAAWRDDIGANVDQGSAYVFTRSGTVWTQQQKLTAADGTGNDLFGTSVSVYGDTAIVGAYFEAVGANTFQGAAYVFVRSGSVWTQQQKLSASDGAPSDGFGISVAIYGETAVVGSWFDNVGANTDQGSAYVFVRSGTVWNQQQQLTATDGAAADRFGVSVAIFNNTVIVGADLDDVGANTDQGSAYVFTRSATTWTQQQKLNGTDGAAGDNFGSSVAIYAETAVVGAFADDIGANSDQGSAFVYKRSGSVWTQQPALTSADGAAGDEFGLAVAIYGDTIIVGADGDDFGTTTNQGSAYAFRVLGTNWSQVSQKVASDGAAGDNFGNSVAISGDTAVVGAPFDDIGANANQGSAYIFVRSGGAWTQQQKVTVADGAVDDLFGNSVAVYGDTIVVGARIDDVGANADQGSAYVFTRTGTVWTQQAQLTAADGAAGDHFGVSVAIDGNTVIVGAFFDIVGVNIFRGSAYVFTRTGTVWSQQQQLTASNGTDEDYFGTSVSISANTAVVGAFGTNFSQGSAYVFERSGTVWNQQQILTAADGVSGDDFGNSVAVSGNSLIVGASAAGVGANVFQGAAYVYTRSGVVWTQQQKLTASDGLGSDQFGTSVGISGDIAVIGAAFDDGSAGVDQGSAYVFSRTGTVWTQQQKLTASVATANDRFGIGVSLSGDKFIVGAPLSDLSVSVPFAPEAANQGAAFIFANSFVPTAAGVSVGGRVLTSRGSGVRNAIVRITKPDGETLETRTGTFGYYRFDDLAAGGTYIVDVKSKRFTFPSQIVTANDNLSNVDFMAQE